MPAENNWEILLDTFKSVKQEIVNLTDKYNSEVLRLWIKVTQLEESIKAIGESNKKAIDNWKWMLALIVPTIISIVALILSYSTSHHK